VSTATKLQRISAGETVARQLESAASLALEPGGSPQISERQPITPEVGLQPSPDRGRSQLRVVEPPPLAFSGAQQYSHLPHDHTNHGNEMVSTDGKGLFIKRIYYMPLSEASVVALTNPKTLHNWVRQGTKFEGLPLDTYHVPFLNRLFITKESAQRVAKRLVKWPSGDPAGLVTLGATDDHSGYIGLPEAKQILGIGRQTMWLWVTQGNAPLGRPLDVIRCTTSTHFYIRESDVFALKANLPKGPLPRGPRPRTSKSAPRL
jgi:hypothetical protein